MQPDEAFRIQNLKTYAILDTPAEREFDELTELAARLCNAPLAAVTFVDEYRVWMKSKVGFGFQENPRSASFCQEVVEKRDEVLVSDMNEHPVFAKLPSVVSEPYIKFYAGFPLISQEGFVLGALCVLDKIPRILNSEQKIFLRTLANQLCALLEKNRLGIELEFEKQKNKDNERLTHLGKMAASIVHEINNPLTVLQARATMLTPENAIENGKKMLETTRRMIKIIGGLSLTVEQNSSENEEEVFIKDIIEETLSFCHTKFASSDVELEYQPIASHLKIKCRPVQISQVILNLLNNAHDAASEVLSKKQWVRLEVEENEHFVIISVVDSGNLIPSEKAEKIFAPFFTTKMPGKGTGLGLSIAREIMEAHHGTLKLNSAARNTTFSLSLPK